MVVDSERMPAEKSSGYWAMQRIFGVKASGGRPGLVRVSGVMVITSEGLATDLPSADWGAGISRNALSAVGRGGIVLEGKWWDKTRYDLGEIPFVRAASTS